MTSATDQLQTPGLFSTDAACEELYSRLAELEAVRRADLEVTRLVSLLVVPAYPEQDVATLLKRRQAALDNEAAPPGV